MARKTAAAIHFCVVLCMEDIVTESGPKKNQAAAEINLSQAKGRKNLCPGS
jgi:hypothetical protein